MMERRLASFVLLLFFSVYLYLLQKSFDVLTAIRLHYSHWFCIFLDYPFGFSVLYNLFGLTIWSKESGLPLYCYEMVRETLQIFVTRKNVKKRNWNYRVQVVRLTIMLMMTIFILFQLIVISRKEHCLPSLVTSSLPTSI